MIKINFNLAPKRRPRQFSYTPRYYKPDKDKSEIRRTRIKAAYGHAEVIPADPKEAFRFRMKKEWGTEAYSSAANSKIRRKLIRYVLIIGIIVIIALNI